jgi:hypothetical protein
MNLQKKLIILLLMITSLYACQSPGNRVRSKQALVCNDIQLPNSAIIQDGEVITYRSKSYILSDRYIAIATHSGKLVECGKISQCVIRWTEYERDCEIEQRTLIFNILGHRKKCSIPKPNCY